MRGRERPRIARDLAAAGARRAVARRPGKGGQRRVHRPEVARRVEQHLRPVVEDPPYEPLGDGDDVVLVEEQAKPLLGVVVPQVLARGVVAPAVGLHEGLGHRDPVRLHAGPERRPPHAPAPELLLQDASPRPPRRARSKTSGSTPSARAARAGPTRRGRTRRRRTAAPARGPAAACAGARPRAAARRRRRGRTRRRARGPSGPAAAATRRRGPGRARSTRRRARARRAPPRPRRARATSGGRRASSGGRRGAPRRTGRGRGTAGTRGRGARPASATAAARGRRRRRGPPGAAAGAGRCLGRRRLAGRGERRVVSGRRLDGRLGGRRLERRRRGQAQRVVAAARPPRRARHAAMRLSRSARMYWALARR